MRPFLKGCERLIVRVGICSSPLTSRATASSPSVVPAKTRLPDAKITSGLSVSGSTTTSPRIPCALRISPTIAYSDAGIVRKTGALSGCFVRFFGHRNRGAFALNPQPLLVTLLEHSGAPKERPHGIGGLRTEVQPVIGA